MQSHDFTPSLTLVEFYRCSAVRRSNYALGGRVFEADAFHPEPSLRCLPLPLFLFLMIQPVMLCSSSCRVPQFWGHIDTGY